MRKLIGDNDSDWEENGPIRGVRYKTGDGVERNAKANLTVVCDGLNSNLRKNFMDPKINLPSFFVGLLLRSECFCLYDSYVKTCWQLTRKRNLKKV